MAKTENKENKIDRKEKLFTDFYITTTYALEALERQFNVKDVLSQVLGKDVTEEESKAKLRASRPWATLSTLYDYAVDGVDHGEEPEDFVIDGSDVLKLVSTENHTPSKEWEDIVTMGDGRFALDTGEIIDLYRVALLANVDIRTVRNAASSGDLVLYKQNDMLYVENASARRWLMGRRGFKPTVMNNEAQNLSLASVNSPAEFGVFLVCQRKRINLDSDDGKLVVFHPSVKPQAIIELEAGVFTLPLDAVFPIADFYQVSRKELLECVMRVFFYEEMRILSGETTKEDAQNEIL